MNSIELIEESERLDAVSKSYSWVAMIAFTCLIGIPILCCVISIVIEGLGYHTLANLIITYGLVSCPVGIVIGLVYAIPMSFVQTKRDNCRKLAIHQFGKDEEEYW